MRGSVTDLNDLDRLYEAVKAERGGLDILFANAGTGSFAPLGEITPEHYDQTFDLNVKGLVFTVQKALPLMSAGSSIILNGSTTGVMGTPAVQHLQRHQGGGPKPGAQLGSRPEGHGHSRQCPVARTDHDGVGTRGL